MARFAAENVPVIHLVQINELALRYDLPTELAVVPQVGEGNVYAPQTYNSWLAAGGLLCIVLILTLPGRFQNPFRRIPGANHGARKTTKSNGKPHPESEAYGCANSPQVKDPIL